MQPQAANASTMEDISSRTDAVYPVEHEQTRLLEGNGQRHVENTDKQSHSEA